MFLIIQTNENGDLPKNEEDHCYLNHSCLSSCSFGSFDRAWQADTEQEAEGMIERIQARNPTNCMIIEL